MTSAYSINLNFNNTIPVKTDFTFKQGDKGITLNLATTGLDPTGTTAHIVFKRSNGTSVEAELTGQTGPSYSYTILGNEFEIPGVVVADLKLYNGDTQRVSTASFIFLVTGDTMDGVGGGTGGYSDQLEELSQEFSDTLEEYKDAFGDVGAINPRGEYSALEEYTALDLVSYNGNSYLCREGCTGIAPTNTTYWQVFATGGGTDDYEDLENKPSINGVELSGDKSTGDLGIEFNDLDDVDMAGATDGQVPTWDATAQKYKPGTPAAGGGTNPNLLINPWFTVNQRGVSSGTLVLNQYGLDRWQWDYGNNAGTYSVGSSGVTLTPGAGATENAKVNQKLENGSALNGYTLTASIKLADGTIQSGTITRASGTSQTFFGSSSAAGLMVDITSSEVIRFRTIKNAATIRAVKLEIGSTSTLHLDTAPDYTTELLKCQRDYKKYTASEGNAYFLPITVQTSSSVYGLLNIGDMRSSPSVSYSGTFEAYMNNANYSVTYAGAVTRVNGFILLMFEGTGLPTGTSGQLKLKSAGDYIAFSSDL